jgi:hypothetical protein
MRKIALLIVVFALSGAVVSAQLKKFRWEDDVCKFEGTFDAKKYTAAQLKNTYALYTSSEFEMIVVEAAVFKYEDIGKLSTVEALDAEYARKSAALQKLEIVNTPYWKAFKQLKIKALERAWQLARVSVQAYRNPAALKELTFADACVQRFVPPLIAGGDELLRVWRESSEERRRKNGNPALQKQRFDEEFASADRLKYAQVNVITFGWWNCVNAEIDRGEDYAAIEKNYTKLFKRVKQIKCEEP